MNKIESFKINHLALLPGVYVSRRDVLPQGGVVTTFDIRLTRPYYEPAVSGAALHTIEHLAATFLRNHKEWGDRIVYWGPMGCRTGSYLIVSGGFVSEDIIPLLRELFIFIANYQREIPGASPIECGNAPYNNITEARRVARRFIDEVLVNPTADRLNYPERCATE